MNGYYKQLINRQLCNEEEIMIISPTNNNNNNNRMKEEKDRMSGSKYSSEYSDKK